MLKIASIGALQGEMIRDRLVVGIRDSILSEHLQLDPSLTLEKTKTAIRQKEAIHEQQDFLKGDINTNPTTLDAVVKATRRSHLTPQHSVEKVTKPTGARPT